MSDLATAIGVFFMTNTTTSPGNPLQTNEGTLPDERVIDDLVARWRIVEARAAEVEANMLNTEAGQNRSSLSVAALLGLSTEVEQEQLDLLQAIASEKSLDISDIAKKLTVWKSIVCPTASDEMALQPVDALILSVLRDLSE